jgi:hypothetical protein
MPIFRVADPDPGSGMGPGSQIRIFPSGSLQGHKDSGSGIRIRDVRDEHPGSYFRELRNQVGFKIVKFFDADPDPGYGIFLILNSGSGMEKIRIRDPG